MYVKDFVTAARELRDCSIPESSGRLRRRLSGLRYKPRSVLCGINLGFSYSLRRPILGPDQLSQRED